ncbi:MAG TPA: helix-hairpin-helix domain-containing protein [Casimicrobiaceae bacterium]|nr:helix-hairpin-helix domain-containing protein [Casimicrobiaceae bacterium]
MTAAHGRAAARDPDNLRIAQWLREAAGLLHAQGANPFRVGAYRKAADTVLQHEGSLGTLFADRGRAGLDALPGIGTGIAAAIAEMFERGRWSQLDRLRGSLDPEHLFRTVPGVGPGLAGRIHDTLGVETLEALEVAAHEGRLEQVPGVGPRRAAAIRAALAEILDRTPLARRATPTAASEPDVAMLLDVDREYLTRADAGALPTIAPRRFNPGNEAWLPVLHTHRGHWHFTALYSNTARAHELGRTRDWVVLYFHDADHAERQRTIVTEQRGPLRGRRVVRGRETECLAHHERAKTDTSIPAKAAARRQA